MAILLSIELVLTVALFSHMGHAGRAAYARARLECHQHPTVETRQAFERQKRISKIEQRGFTGLVWCALGTGIVLVYQIRRGEPCASPNGDPAERFGNSGVGGGPPSVS